MSYRPIYDPKTNIPEERKYRVGITGASTSDPTKRVGPGVTVTRTAAGVIKYSFAENPGLFVEIEGHAFGAVTPSGVKGYSMSRGVYTSPSGSTAGYIELSFWDASNAAVDLTSVQYFDVTFVFTELASLP